MECLFVDPRDVDEPSGTLTLKGAEAHHASKVLRLRAGDRFMATDGAGKMYQVTLSNVITNGKHLLEVAGSIQQTLPEFGEPLRDIQLIQAMLSQPARWEFLLEKATELGVRSIIPIETERTEKRGMKQERSDRILLAALKQTKRSRLPLLSELSTLSRALDTASREARKIYILHESAPLEAMLSRFIARDQPQRIALIVGPEGGFTEEEVNEAVAKTSAEQVSLGERRLRAETAAIAALSIAQLV